MESKRATTTYFPEGKKEKAAKPLLGKEERRLVGGDLRKRRETLEGTNHEETKGGRTPLLVRKGAALTQKNQGCGEKPVRGVEVEISDGDAAKSSREKFKARPQKHV